MIKNSLRNLVRSSILSSAECLLPVDLYMPNTLRILLLHGQDGDVALSNLRLILHSLSVHCTFIDLDTALDLLINPNYSADKRSYIAITIDDGLKNSLPILQLLSSFGINATQYICPYLLLHASESFYSDAVFTRLGQLPRFMSTDDVKYSLSLGHSIGSHGLEHIILSNMTTDEIKSDLFASYKQLHSIFAVPITSYAWPRGQMKHISSSALSIFLSDHPYRTIVSGIRGYHHLSSIESFNVSSSPYLYRNSINLFDKPERSLLFLSRSFLDPFSIFSNE